MSKVVKAVTGAVKNIVSGVNKVFKAVTKSPIGKALLIGAAIYLGGGAMGLWETPFSSVNNFFVKEAAGSAANALTGAPTSAAEAAVAGGAAGEAALPVDVSTRLGMHNLIPGAEGFVPGGEVTFGTEMSPVLGAESLPPVSRAATEPGIVSKVMNTGTEAVKSGAEWVQRNPWPAALALNTAAKMMSPDEIDLLREKQRLEQQQREQILAQQSGNLDVGNVNLGFQPSQSGVLLDKQGNPIYPLISSRMRRA